MESNFLDMCRNIGVQGSELGIFRGLMEIFRVRGYDAETASRGEVADLVEGIESRNGIAALNAMKSLLFQNK